MSGPSREATPLFVVAHGAGAGERAARGRGGNHSLEAGKRALAAAGEGQEDVDARVAAAVERFVEGRPAAQS